MNHIDTLSELFAKFPGIGMRQSKRFVYFLLSQPSTYVNDLAKAIRELQQATNTCKACFVHFENNDAELCAMCSKPTIDTTTLLIVSKDSDYENIRRTNIYHGRIFVLGGLVPAIETNVEQYIRIRELEEKIKEYIKTGLKEIVLALSLTPQGEHTDHYLRVRLAPYITTDTVSLSSLGRGLSTGSELEYADTETMANAFKNRH
ncbi:recombination protein RecR [Candidatus Nomurabacteria bacterium]|jgi:recombination protein RecR|nr:MAG: recombination protein RecR [Candidatus Nomurabacteria bacterium]